MYSTIYTGGLHGMESYLARVEVDISRGLPGFEMVGLLGSEVKAVSYTHLTLPTIA